MISGRSVLSTGEVFPISLTYLLDLLCLLGFLLPDFLFVPVVFALSADVEVWAEVLEAEGKTCTTLSPSWEGWEETSSIKFAKTGIS